MFVFTAWATRLIQSISRNVHLSVCPRLKTALTDGLETYG